jgi:hypothetical protein
VYHPVEGRLDDAIRAKEQKENYLASVRVPNRFSESEQL